jgi:hypothetical protein
MRIQDGPLGHLREVVDQRNAQIMAEIAAATSIRNAKTRPTTKAVASAPASPLRVQAEAYPAPHVDSYA